MHGSNVLPLRCEAERPERRARSSLWSHLSLRQQFFVAAGSQTQEGDEDVQGRRGRRSTCTEDQGHLRRRTAPAAGGGQGSFHTLTRVHPADLLNEGLVKTGDDGAAYWNHEVLVQALHKGVDPPDTSALVRERRAQPPASSAAQTCQSKAPLPPPGGSYQHYPNPFPLSRVCRGSHQKNETSRGLPSVPAGSGACTWTPVLHRRC